MPNTMTLIASATVGGGGGSVVFNSIPQTYTDLRIIMSARSGRAANQEDALYVSPNGLTTGFTYYWYGSTGNSFVTGITNFGQLWAGRIPAATADANTFGAVEIYLPNYTNNRPKIITFDGVTDDNTTTSYRTVNSVVNSTTNAITSLTINAANANLISGSTAYLYGITNTF